MPAVGPVSGNAVPAMVAKVGAQRVGQPAAVVTPRLASPCLIFRMPGITVLTISFIKMKHKAMSDMVVPPGTNGFRRSARSTLGTRFSLQNYGLRQFVYRPAMVSDPSRYGQRRLL